MLKLNTIILQASALQLGQELVEECSSAEPVSWLTGNGSQIINQEIACTLEQIQSRDFQDCDCITARDVDWENIKTDLSPIGLDEDYELENARVKRYNLLFNSREYQAASH